MKNNKISINQLAEICNVSPGTVDRAIHNRSGISQKTKEYILSVAKEYGYRPNKMCLADKKGVVGIVVFDFDEYCSELVMCLDAEFRRRGYCCLIMVSGLNVATEKDCIEVLYNAGACGIILCPINDGKEFYGYLKSWKVPAVTVGAKVEGIKYIGIDNFSAMKSLVSLVAKKGCKKIIYYAIGDEYVYNTYAPMQRLDGFSEAAKGFDDIEFKVFYSKEECLAFADENSGIIAYNDMQALELISSSGFKGIVAGFDGIPGIYRYNVGTITVNHDKLSEAKKVADYILNGGSDEDEFVDYIID